MPEHPRPDTPESKVEHQADQPGVTTGGDHQDANQERKAGASAFKGGLSEEDLGEQPNARSRD